MYLTSTWSAWRNDENERLVRAIGCIIFIDISVSKPSGLVENGKDASKYEPCTGNSAWIWWSFYDEIKFFFIQKKKIQPTILFTK